MCTTILKWQWSGTSGLWSRLAASLRAGATSSPLFPLWPPLALFNPSRNLTRSRALRWATQPESRSGRSLERQLRFGRRPSRSSRESGRVCSTCTPIRTSTWSSPRVLISQPSSHRFGPAQTITRSSLSTTNSSFSHNQGTVQETIAIRIRFRYRMLISSAFTYALPIATHHMRILSPTGPTFWLLRLTSSVALHL